MVIDRIKTLSFGILVILLFYAVDAYIDIQMSLDENEEACFSQLAVAFTNGVDPNTIFQKDFEDLQTLVEYSLVARSQMLKVYDRLRDNRDQPLSSRDLLILKQGADDYLEIREKLYDIAYAYECAVEVEESTLVEFGISPEMRLKGSMLSLAAALTLYDNYLLGAVMFEQDSRLRKLLNDPDMGFGLVSNTLMEMTLNASSIETRHRIRKVILFYEEEKKRLSSTHEDSEFAYLKLLIESSPAYNYVTKTRIKEIASKKFITYARVTSDMLHEASKDSTDLVSKFFGNTIGLYESRKGKLYGNKEAKNNIQSKLQPLDILLEKTPFRLTDKLIPGHFGHVAIWTGTKAELTEMGLWGHNYVKPYGELIEDEADPTSKDKNQIIEALRSGVQLSTLDAFLNIDDLAILRPVFNDSNRNQLRKQALIMAFRQIGKKYDFNFDVNTTDKIVCSELAYVSYPTIDWPTEKTLGRHSISPDHVAKQAWNDVPLKLVLFYHDGKLVPEEEQVDRLIELTQE